jgi:hypothetical protein
MNLVDGCDNRGACRRRGCLPARPSACDLVLRRVDGIAYPLLEIFQPDAQRPELIHPEFGPDRVHESIHYGV